MIHTIGLLWEDSDVFWGAGNQAGKLLGVPETTLTADPVDFRDQIGIYALYAGFDLVSSLAKSVATSLYFIAPRKATRAPAGQMSLLSGTAQDEPLEFGNRPFKLINKRPGRACQSERLDQVVE